MSDSTNNDTNLSIIESFWESSWYEICDDFYKERLGLRVINLHALLDDIIEECKFNSLRKQANRIFFLKRLEQIKEENRLVESFHDAINEIMKQIESKNSVKTRIQCQAFIEQNFGEKYLLHIIGKLDELLTSGKSDFDTLESIYNHSTELIVELSSFGFSIDEIMRFIVSMQNEKNEGVSASSKLMKICELLTVTTNEVYFLYKVNGIENRHEVINHGNCMLLNITNPIYKTLEEKNKESLDYEKLIRSNLIVKVDKNVSVDSSASIARTLADKFISCLKFLNLEKDRDIWINYNEFFALDKNYCQNYLRISIPKDKLIEHISTSKPIVINQSNHKMYLDYFSSLKSYFVDNQDDYRTIENSLVLFINAEKSDSSLERISKYWTALENIVNKFPIAAPKEKIPKDKHVSLVLMSRLIVMYENRKLEEIYLSLLNSYQGNSSIFRYIESGFARRLNLDKGYVIDYEIIKSEIGYIKTLTSDLSMLRKLMHLERIQKGNPNEAEEKNKIVSSHVDLVFYIYKLRNQIIHEANINQKLLPHFTEKSREICTLLFEDIINYNIKSKEGLEGFRKEIENGIKANKVTFSQHFDFAIVK